jgi:hypothetical protein
VKTLRLIVALLLFLFVLPVILLVILPAIWWIFPFVAGVLFWLALRFTRKKYLVPVVIVLLIVTLGWLSWMAQFVLRPKLDHQESYVQSRSTELAKAIAKAIIGGPAQPPVSENDPLRAARRGFSAAIAERRFEISEISDALRLRDAATEANNLRQRGGRADTSDLTGALLNFNQSFLPHKLTGSKDVDTPNLTLSENLRTFVSNMNEFLDSIERDAMSAKLSEVQLRDKQYDILGLIAAKYDLEGLYDATSKLQTALQESLGITVHPQSTFDFRYEQSDGGKGTLIAEQTILIDFQSLHADKIDVRNMIQQFDNADIRQELAVSQGPSAGPEEKLESGKHEMELRPETTNIVLVNRVYLANASYSLVSPRILVPFRGVMLQWFTPLSASVIVSVQLPGNAHTTWPLSIPIQTDLSARPRAVYLPLNSYFYADPQMVLADKPEGCPDSGAAKVGEECDALTPGSQTPTISELYANKVIRVEMLPRGLSWPVIQQYREYLFIGNLITALIIAAVTSVLALVISPRDSSGDAA